MEIIMDQIASMIKTSRTELLCVRAIHRVRDCSGVPEWEMWAVRWLNGTDRSKTAAITAQVAAMRRADAWLKWAETQYEPLWSITTAATAWAAAAAAEVAIRAAARTPSDAAVEKAAELAEEAAQQADLLLAGCDVKTRQKEGFTLDNQSK